MTDSHPVDLPYAEPDQQRRAALTGMHAFLGTEIMLFGGLFLVAAIIRFRFPNDVVEISKQLHSGIGATNTAVLLTASLLAALAVTAAERGRARQVAWYFSGSAALGFVFLCLKAYEYISEYGEGILPVAGSGFKLTPHARLFMDLYLISTSLHAFHLTIGVLALSGFAYAVASGRMLLPGRSVRVENIALYWHLVDLIWIFLFPVLYLAR